METREKMATQGKPKVLVFDIGGVCVVSPFQAILDYETANSIPRGYINYAISASKPNGSWHKLEKGEILLNAAFFAAFRRDIRNPTTWQRYHTQLKKLAVSAVPAEVPEVDAEKLYWTMMSTARETDPHMGPALRRLRRSGKYRLVALSNTSIFPPWHEYNQPSGDDDIRSVFSIFISSAHVGMRKPDRDIYELCMRKIREEWPGEDVKGNGRDVVFLDDIGENLRMGREMGWRTIKVHLGRTRDAVKELQEITGVELLENQGEDGVQRSKL